MIRFVLTIAALCVAVGASATAKAADYKVSNSGSDANDCSMSSPCATLVRVCDLISKGQGGVHNIAIADGSFAGGCRITYHNVVNVTGNCNHPENVVVDPSKNYAFFGQDFPVFTVKCLTIASPNATGIGIQGRQYTIADFLNVRFGSMTIHVAVLDDARANCLSSTILGNAVYHASATGKSSFNYGCPVTMAGGSMRNGFAYAVKKSLIDATGIAVTGTHSGPKCIKDASSEIANMSGLPGTGSC